MHDSTTLNQFFGLPVRRRGPAFRVVYVVAFPCGATWEIETPTRGYDWECPIYAAGEQTGLTAMASTRAALIEELRAEGATVTAERRATANTYA